MVVQGVWSESQCSSLCGNLIWEKACAQVQIENLRPVHAIRFVSILFCVYDVQTVVIMLAFLYQLSIGFSPFRVMVASTSAQLLKKVS